MFVTTNTVTPSKDNNNDDYNDNDNGLSKTAIIIMATVIPISIISIF